MTHVTSIDLCRQQPHIYTRPGKSQWTDLFLLIGLALLGGYQFMLDRSWLATVLAAPHGGMLGSLSWAALLILSTVLADLYHRQKGGSVQLLAGSSLSIVLALVLATWFGISKNRVSATYILLSMGLSGWFFCLFHLLVDRFHLNFSLFSVWGRNPLILYVLHLLLQGLLTLPFADSLGALTPPWLVFIQVVLLLSVLTFIAKTLDRKKMYFCI